jgi:hypothetical protein
LTILDTSTSRNKTLTQTIPTPITKKKLWLKPLQTPFTGKRSDFILFMQDVYVYLKVNRLTYDNNEKKISFILSYLAGGDAAVWKQQFIQTKIEESEEAKSNEPNWGTYKEFVEALKKTFQPYDEPAEVLEDMKKLCLGDGSITKHNSKFWLLVSQTGMKDSPALMDLYREMLSWGLQSPMIRSEHPPKTLEEWYTKATNFYVGHQRAQCLCRKRDKPVNTSSAPPAQKRFSFPEKKDPNAMDIDSMSIKEHTHLIKEGKCFRCKLFGHLSWDCPNKGQNTMLTTTTLKWTGKSAASHIRTLIASMSEEEKKVLEEESEKLGLGS